MRFFQIQDIFTRKKMFKLVKLTDRAVEMKKKLMSGKSREDFIRLTKALIRKALEIRWVLKQTENVQEKVWSPPPFLGILYATVLIYFEHHFCSQELILNTSSFWILRNYILFVGMIELYSSINHSKTSTKRGKLTLFHSYTRKNLFSRVSHSKILWPNFFNCFFSGTIKLRLGKTFVRKIIEYAKQFPSGSLELQSSSTFALDLKSYRANF